jgi:hypothetical protein
MSKQPGSANNIRRTRKIGGTRFRRNGAQSAKPDSAIIKRDGGFSAVHPAFTLASAPISALLNRREHRAYARSAGQRSPPDWEKHLTPHGGSRAV